MHELTSVLKAKQTKKLTLRKLQLEFWDGDYIELKVREHYVVLKKYFGDKIHDAVPAVVSNSETSSSSDNATPVDVAQVQADNRHLARVPEVRQYQEQKQYPSSSHNATSSSHNATPVDVAQVQADHMHLARVAEVRQYQERTEYRTVVWSCDVKAGGQVLRYAWQNDKKICQEWVPSRWRTVAIRVKRIDCSDVCSEPLRIFCSHLDPDQYLCMFKPPKSEEVSSNWLIVPPGRDIMQTLLDVFLLDSKYGSYSREQPTYTKDGRIVLAVECEVVYRPL